MDAQTLSLTRSPFVPVAIGVPTRFLSWNTGGRIVGLLQLVVGIWLMYCTYTTAIRLALGARA
jgi:hypothetical protein